MQEKMTFSDMQNLYRNVVERFNRIELNKWKAEGAMIELSKQVGELAKQVMILMQQKKSCSGSITGFSELLRKIPCSSLTILISNQIPIPSWQL